MCITNSHCKKWFTYRVVKDFSPLNASWATLEMLLFDKSIRRNRLKLENDFGGISVIKFCSNRLNNNVLFFINVCNEKRTFLTIQLYLQVKLLVLLLNSFHDNQQYHQHICMGADIRLSHHTRWEHFRSNLEQYEMKTLYHITYETNHKLYNITNPIRRNTIIRYLYCNFLSFHSIIV